MPEQGQSRVVLPVRSRALSRRHGAVTCSARIRCPGFETLSVGCGYSPALVVAVPAAALAGGTAAAADHLPGEPPTG
jgi:hypothetical protein